MLHSSLFDHLIEQIISFGASKAAVISVDKIQLDSSFRALCAANTCGLYGQNWMCPPHVGEISDLMKTFKTYQYALVYQTISRLEDSFDFEGMIEAKKNFQTLTHHILRNFKSEEMKRTLHLGAGGCEICETCAIKTEEPCRYPQLALASLEAYGVNVSKLAEAAGMNYINGAGTVTYFGVVLFDL